MLRNLVIATLLFWLAIGVERCCAEPGVVAAAGCCASPPSEGTVSKALKWFKAQQQHDGSWPSPPAADDRDSKSRQISATHSTALVMLCYIGAGQTTRDGGYQEPMRVGAKYLASQLSQSEYEGDLRGKGDDLAAHGVAAWALAEAYSMTHDKELLAPVQLALNLTQSSQDPKSGGWGPQLRDGDDMHVVGWQLLALRSGRLAGQRQV